MYNATSGFDLRDLKTGDYIRTYPLGDGQGNAKPKQVAFGEMTDVVVGGGDDGLVRVYDWRTGVLREMLSHKPSKLIAIFPERNQAGPAVQTITVSLFTCL